MNWSALDKALLPPGVVTVTSTVPAAPAGAMATILPADNEVTDAGTVPNNTTAGLAKPEPVIVTDVPPDSGPDAGAT